MGVLVPVKRLKVHVGMLSVTPEWELVNWNFSLKPTLAAFGVITFEIKTNQNLGRNRKYQVFKTGHGDRLGDERRSSSLTPSMLHDPSFLLEDQRDLHLTSGLSRAFSLNMAL